MAAPDWLDLQERIARYASSYDVFTIEERQAFRNQLFPDLYLGIEEAARRAAGSGGSAQVTETSRQVSYDFWRRHGFTDLVMKINAREHGTAKQYVARSLANEFVSWLRRNGRRQEAEIGLDDDLWLAICNGTHHSDDSPEHRAVERVRLLRALGTLNEQLHEVLYLRYVSDLTLPECAEQLGCSLATVKRRKDEALAELRGLISASVIDEQSFGSGGKA